MNFDLVIIGGGVGGLYAAWRLRESGLKLAVVEKAERFGGRLCTVKDPAGFPCDLGAMRFLPESHPIIRHLKEYFSIPTEEIFITKPGNNNTAKHFIRNKYVDEQEKAAIFLKRPDLDKYNPDSRKYACDLMVDEAEEAKVYSACFEDGRKSYEVSKFEYVSRAGDSSIFVQDLHDPIDCTIADEKSFFQRFGNFSGDHYVTPLAGMGEFIDILLNDLRMSPNVSLLPSHCITEIKEHPMESFELIVQNTETKPMHPNVQAKSIIIACNGTGMKYIHFSSPFPRAAGLLRIFDRFTPIPAFKLFLSYPTAWWEEHGLYTGSVQTDLPIGEVVAFGERAKNEGYCTLLAAFTYGYSEVFEGLNLPNLEKYNFKREFELSEDLKPSKQLVEYVQDQLKIMFDRTAAIPDPIFGVCKLWINEVMGHHQSRPGTNPDVLQWKGLKPFPDCALYMTGDTFFAVDDIGTLLGWSEGVLLNSERIVTQYFNEQPIIEGLNLSPKTTSKLVVGAEKLRR